MLVHITHIGSEDVPRRAFDGGPVPHPLAQFQDRFGATLIPDNLREKIFWYPLNRKADGADHHLLMDSLAVRPGRLHTYIDGMRANITRNYGRGEGDRGALATLGVPQRDTRRVLLIEDSSRFLHARWDRKLKGWLAAQLRLTGPLTVIIYPRENVVNHGLASIERDDTAPIEGVTLFRVTQNPFARPDDSALSTGNILSRFAAASCIANADFSYADRRHTASPAPAYEGKDSEPLSSLHRLLVETIARELGLSSLESAHPPRQAATILPFPKPGGT